MASRILLVEDSATQAEALCALLHEQHHDVSIASSGEEALDLVREVQFDLILSDIVMPGIDGYELCRRLKVDPEQSHVPVVLLTSLHDPMDIVRGLEAGADNYITKPYEPDQLLARVRRVLDNRGLRRDVRTSIGMKIAFLGSTFTITSDREQILDLLLSSIEDVVQTNQALEESRRSLAEANAELESYALWQAREARISTGKYRALMESAGDAIFVLDSAGKILEANARSAELLGRTLDELVEHPASSFIAGGEDAEAFQSCVRQSAIGLRVSTDLRLVHSSGDRIHCEAALSLSRTEGTDLLLAIVRDVTERRQAQARSQQLIREQVARAEAEVAERRITGILESIANVFFALDPRWRFTFVNSKAEAYFGRPRQELLGRSIWETFPQLLDTPMAAALRCAQDERIPAETEVASVLNPGAWFEVHAYPTPEGISVYTNNITLRKEMGEALRESEQRFRQLADSMDEVFWMFTPDFRETLYVSPAYERVFGQSASSLYSDPQQFMAVVIPEDRDSLLQVMEEIRFKPVAIEFRIDHPEKGIRWLAGRGVPIQDAHGGEYRIAGLTGDITERKAADADIRRAKEEAERANQAKSEFLSRMSHELRTPMNGILGFGQLLEYSDLDADDRESVEQILKAGRHLLALINEVLDLSRVESGRITLSLEPVSIRNAVQQVTGLLRMSAVARGITLDNGVQGLCDHFVFADPQRLNQVLLNLLSNAIKYNRDGGCITIRAEARPGDSLRILVQDSGLGIPAERMHRLFTPFDRLGVEATGIEGTGLGLALSKGFILAMGGSIGVESTPEEGSTFWIDLPLSTGSRESGEPVTAPSHRDHDEHQVPRTVLYIEDNLSNLRLMERIFTERPEVKLLVAMQGGIGLELAHDNLPDLILLDLNLPDMPGLEVLQRLQKHLELRRTPVVIISADATPQQIRHLLSQGASSYLTKPIDVKELLTQVDELLVREDRG